jgi:hypothetical protein
MDGQIHNTASKPPRVREEHIFIEQEAGRASEPIRMLWRREKYVASLVIRIPYRPTTINTHLNKAQFLSCCNNC